MGFPGTLNDEQREEYERDELRRKYNLCATLYLKRMHFIIGEILRKRKGD